MYIVASLWTVVRSEFFIDAKSAHSSSFQCAIFHFNAQIARCAALTLSLYGANVDEVNCNMLDLSETSGFTTFKYL